MGSSLLKGMAKFKITVWYGDIHYEDCPTSLRTLYNKMEENQFEPTPDIIINSWKFLSKPKVLNELIVGVLIKDKHTVYEINEDPDSAGGGIIQSFFADKEEDLKEFCKDWGFDSRKIKKNQAVAQVL